jgi:hypothetical protein
LENKAFLENESNKEGKNELLEAYNRLKTKI